MKPYLVYLGSHRLPQEGAVGPGRRPQGADLREGRRNGRALQQKSTSNCVALCHPEGWYHHQMPEQRGSGPTAEPGQHGALNKNLADRHQI